MKLKYGALVLLLSTCAVAQDAPAAQPARPMSMHGAMQPAKSTNDDKLKADVKADTAVVTVSGVCEPAEKDCKTVVTRGQFENTLLGLSGGAPVAPDVPRRFASQYGELLVFSQEAVKLGMDKEAQVDAAYRFARLQILATRYLRTLQEKSQPTNAEIQKYYDNNQAQFQGTAVDRLLIPGGHVKSMKPEEVQALGEEMKKRLAAGEDAAELQGEIYAKLKLTDPPRSSLTLPEGTPELQAVAKLKVGEVSELHKDMMATSVYRLQGPKTLPLETVTDKIRALLSEQKLKAAVDVVMGDRKSLLNDAYFGPETPKNPHEQ
jgi:hypothetical protein